VPAKELLARQEYGRGRRVPPTAEAEIRGGEHCLGTSRSRDISSDNHETAITTLITYGNNPIGLLALLAIPTLYRTKVGYPPTVEPPWTGYSPFWPAHTVQPRSVNSRPVSPCTSVIATGMVHVVVSRRGPKQPTTPRSGCMRFARKLASVWTDRWLVWLIVASLVLPPTFYGLVARQSRVATFAAADQHLVVTVRLLREHAEKVFDTDELVTEQVDRLTVGLSWDEIAHSEALHRQLKQLDDQLPQVNGIYVVAPDGTVANSGRLFPPRKSNLSDSAYFALLRDGYQGSVISDVHRGRTSGLLQFNLARRLSSPDRGFNGDGEELAYYPTPMFSGSRAPADLIASLPLKEPVLVTSIPWRTTRVNGGLPSSGLADIHSSLASACRLPRLLQVGTKLSF
jgi:hypothetical protein